MNKKIETLIKFLIINSLFFMILIPTTILISQLFVYYKNPELVEFISNASLVLGMILGTIMMGLQFYYGGIRVKPTKSEKFKSSFSNFTDISLYLDKELKNKKYEQLLNFKVKNIEDSKFFVRKKNFHNQIFILVYCNELTEEIFNNIETAKINMIKKQKLNQRKAIITMICANYRTPLIIKYVDNNILQSFGVSKLPVALTFDNNTVYVAKQKDGLFINEYRKLRRQFLEIMGVKISKK